MSDKRYPDEFRIEAVRQIVERDHKVADTDEKGLPAVEKTIYTGYTHQ